MSTAAAAKQSGLPLLPPRNCFAAEAERKPVPVLRSTRQPCFGGPSWLCAGVPARQELGVLPRPLSKGAAAQPLEMGACQQAESPPQTQAGKNNQPGEAGSDLGGAQTPWLPPLLAPEGREGSKLLIAAIIMQHFCKRLISAALSANTRVGVDNQACFTEGEARARGSNLCTCEQGLELEPHSSKSSSSHWACCEYTLPSGSPCYI